MARYEPHDKFFRRARAQGLPSRAAFKLQELIARFKLIRPGARVLDLGCAPGGWLVILSPAVGDRGRVVGIDIAPCSAAFSNVVTLCADLIKPEVRQSAIRELGGPADLITSDLAPKLSGIRESDQARTLELLKIAVELADHALRSGGSMIAKIFMNAVFDEARTLFADRFKRVDIVHTRASRPGSAELYVVARDFIGRRAR